MRKLKPIYIVVLCWLLFMVIDSLKKNGLFSNGPFFLYQYLPGTIFWMALTLPSFWLFSKTAKLAMSKRISVLLGMGVVIGFAKNVTTWFVWFIHGTVTDRFTFSWESLKIFYSKVVLFYYMEAIIIAWVMLIVFFILELYRNFRAKSQEAMALESQLAKAQLESLRMQLQPHFLFNAHNTVSMLIRTKQYDQATEMISKISDLLRNSLNSQEAQLVPLSRELELITAYLEIEEVRFEDHLEIKFDLDESVEQYLVPHLLLQPIIENAFKHGVSKNLGRSALSIKTENMNGNLRLSVHNTGPALPEKWNLHERSGIGLSNTQQRLTKLYAPGTYRFEIFNDGDGVTVSIDLPLNAASID